MSYWHYDDGSPAPWGKGRFDWSHVTFFCMLLLILLMAALEPWLKR